MRLPLAIPLDSRDGDADQDGRLVNMVVEQYEDKLFVEPRPGLSVVSLANGTADGVVCFNGQLVSLFGAKFGVFDLESPEWDSGTTYDFQSSVWYLGDFYFSLFGNNSGNTPTGGIGWTSEYPTDPGWNPDEQYEIDDSVVVDGVPYFSYSNQNTGNSPPDNPFLWGTTPAPSTRFYVSGGGVTTGPTGATNSAACAAWYPLTTYATGPRTCPGVSPFFTWYTGSFTIVGSFANVEQNGTAGIRECGDPANGPFSVAGGQIFQTA